MILTSDGMLLNGTIPLEIMYLSNLQAISLSRNSLTGPIPSELGTLSKLRHLDLEDNYFTGGIPKEIVDILAGVAASGLVHLDLSWNPLLPSSIPTEIGGISNLERLFLNGIELVGTIPYELYQLSRLGKNSFA